MGEAQGKVVYGGVADVCGAEVESRAYAESRGRAAHTGPQGEVGKKTGFDACGDL